MTSRKHQISIVLLTLFAVVIADQVTKAIVIYTIPVDSVSPFGREHEFFYFVHTRNTGLVGGAFRDTPIVAKTAPLIASVVLLFLFGQLNPASRMQALLYGLVAGGAVGNLIDRYLRGSVVDFLQFNFYFIPFDFSWKHYPAFNVADSCICVGVFLLMITWHKLDRRHVPEAA